MRTYSDLLKENLRPLTATELADENKELRRALKSAMDNWQYYERRLSAARQLLNTT